MLASFLFGAAWNAWGMQTAFVAFATAFVLVLPFAAASLHRLERLP